MAWKKILIVSLALGVAPGLGCKTKSNTTEQTQSPPGTGDTSTGNNPHQPNPVNAQSGSAMGTEATAVGGANNPMSDAGVSGGDGGVGGAAGETGGAGSATR